MNFNEAAYAVFYSGDDENRHRRIIETVTRLPEDVAEFAADRARVHYVSVGASNYGMTLSGKAIARLTPDGWDPEGSFFVVLVDPLPEAHAHSIIAHEIAHAWLGHDRLGDAPEDCEIQVCKLVASWGFVGIGADAEHCHIPV
jgi:hypothetical protein